MSEKPFSSLAIRPAIISALLLIFWGAWIIGIQSYVLVSYTQKFGDYHDLPGSNNDQSSDAAWGNAYNGMALASAVASMLIGLFILIAVPERTAPMLTTTLILTVMGALGAVAALVLSALESRLLDWRNNAVSNHPCKLCMDGSCVPAGSTWPKNLYPTELDCTNWFALELTVTSMCGLTFVSYVVILIVVARGLSHRGHGPSADKQLNSPPYSAYNSPVVGHQQQQVTTNDPWLDQHNPKYNHHLHQVSLQHQQQQTVTIQRGQLQMLHNARTSGITNSSRPVPTPIPPTHQQQAQRSSSNVNNYSRF